MSSTSVTPPEPAAAPAGPALPAQILEMLVTEHERFAALLAILEEQLQILHQGGEPDYDLLRDLFFYLTHYPDRFHHPKEDFMFARLAQRMPPARKQVEAVQRLHRALAESGARFLANLDAMLAGTIMPRRALEEPARDYVAQYREHMALERRHLFPLVQTHLQQRDWTEVTAALGIKYDSIFDEPVQARFRALHKRIAAVVEK